MGGPYYTGPLQDVPFVDRAIAHLESADGHARYATADRILGVLRVAREELPRAPLYYDLHATFGAMSLSAPTMLTLQSALANAGFGFSQYHGRSTAIKVRQRFFPPRCRRPPGPRAALCPLADGGTDVVCDGLGAGVGQGEADREEENG